MEGTTGVAIKMRLKISAFGLVFNLTAMVINSERNHPDQGRRRHFATPSIFTLASDKIEHMRTEFEILPMSGEALHARAPPRIEHLIDPDPPTKSPSL